MTSFLLPSTCPSSLSLYPVSLLFLFRYSLFLPFLSSYSSNSSPLPIANRLPGPLNPPPQRRRSPHHPRQLQRPRRPHHLRLPQKMGRPRRTRHKRKSQRRKHSRGDQSK